MLFRSDVGFMIGCSFLNGYRIGGKEEYKDVIVEAARSLSTRFRPGAKVIQSWDADRGWQGERGWECPVIIDNMMNLELLFEATKFSGDSSFYHVAVDHANTTLAHHFREDNSCYHVIDYALDLSILAIYLLLVPSLFKIYPTEVSAKSPVLTVALYLYSLTVVVAVAF